MSDVVQCGALLGPPTTCRLPEGHSGDHRSVIGFPPDIARLFGEGLISLDAERAKLRRMVGQMRVAVVLTFSAGFVFCIATLIRLLPS